MDLAMATADDIGADLVLANDPDADRCAVAVPGPHGWRMLSGDEVGALLGDFALRSGLEGVYASSVVSSSLLGVLATAYGQPHRETLTGFKWIGRVPGLVFGYEEALGFCVAPHVVRDKDGISALLKVAELAAALKAEGRTLTDRLDDIARDHGLHATDQLSVRVADASQTASTMARLREAPPLWLGDLAVERVEDLAQGSGELPPTDAIRYRLAEHARVIVRPSGTEPKIKCYLQVVVPVDAAEEDGVDAARIVAVQRLDAIRKDLDRALSR
jgi:phosphomannomutase